MMMKKALLAAVAALLIGLGAQAQKLTSNVGKVADGYNFWLYTPDASLDDEVEAKPLIIFLHGASLCGNDLNRVRRYGTIDAIEKGRKLDAYVIAPQNPGGSWNPQRIMNVVDYVTDNHNVDYDRIYVMGMSLGGYGTIDLTASYPDRIAAAMAFCGGGTVNDLSGLNDVPLWIVHGTADRAVNVSQSDRVAQALHSAAGGDAPRLIYDRIPGMNHSQPARLFYLQESYDWLLGHTLKDKTRKPRETFAISSEMMRSAYSDLKSSGSSKSKKRTA
ncbi:MAG: prolyl oligopeptidase family serine peptidase, partial [Muribaculaceae bacterium]|nr:prolyl oligopeptidase family serine peptidase [Muribaculaceae bacterium]